MKLLVLILCAFLFASPISPHFAIPVSAYAEKAPAEKSKKYTYKEEVFLVSLSKDGVTGTIRVNEDNGQFLASVPDGMIAYNYKDAGTALNEACERILNKISGSSKGALEKRHSQLEDLFKSIKD